MGKCSCSATTLFLIYWNSERNSKTHEVRRPPNETVLINGLQPKENTRDADGADDDTAEKCTTQTQTNNYSLSHLFKPTPFLPL